MVEEEDEWRRRMILTVLLFDSRVEDVMGYARGWMVDCYMQ